MNDSSFLLPLVVLVGAVLGSRLIPERALEGLASADRERATEAVRVLSVVQILGLAILVVVALNAPAFGFSWALIHFAIMGALIAQRLTSRGLPASYRNAHILALGVQFVGFVVYLVLMFRGGTGPV